MLKLNRKNLMPMKSNKANEHDEFVVKILRVNIERKKHSALLKDLSS